MKHLFIAAALLVATSTNAQAQSAKKDTVLVPVPMVFDTIRTNVLTTNKRRDVKMQPALVVVKGYKNQKGEWYERPAVHAVLDSKKRAIKNVLQIL